MTPWMRVGIPLAILLIVALIILALVLYQRHRSAETSRRERLLAEKRWDGVCRFDNPETGAKCTREEFHLENHYREVNGVLVIWP